MINLPEIAAEMVHFGLLDPLDGEAIIQMCDDMGEGDTLTVPDSLEPAMMKVALYLIPEGKMQ